VVGAASVQLPAWLVSSTLFIMVVGHERMWVVLGFLGKWEGERGRNKHCKCGGKPSSLAFACLGEEDGKQCHKNGTICCFLSFKKMNCE